MIEIEATAVACGLLIPINHRDVRRLRWVGYPSGHIRTRSSP